MKAVTKFTQEHVSHEDQFKFYADASSLGWKPGYVPRTLETTLGNGQTLQLCNEGLPKSFHYSQPFGCIRVIIFNG